MTGDKNISQTKRVLGFFIISGITLGLVLFASSSSKTWEALGMINLRSIMVLTILSALMFVFDALRTVILSHSLGHPLPILHAMKIMFIGRFFGAITPLQSGMMPAEMYMLHRHGLPLGQAISIDVIKRIATMGVLAIGGVVVLLFDKTLSSNRVMVYVYYYVVFFYIFLTGIFFFVYLFPKQTHWIINQVMDRLHKMGRVKDYGIDKYVHNIAKDYSWSLDFYLHNGFISFLASLAATIVFIVIQFIMAPVIIHCLGFSSSYMEAFKAQVILMPMLYFSPTPGGSGIAEGGFALLFSSFIPKYLIGITVVLWRVFITYIGVGIGGLLAMGSIDPNKILGRKKGIL